ncbi:uncharacterized protein LOC141698683 [Apium graveolens]|uniref:uncharacterized protein LOC141698683 n=1 Tax=Apium graveolens TaxID=4045 RepID=UPI003D7B3C3F
MCKLFYDLLRKNKGFTWSEKHKALLRDLKTYLTTPPLLSKPLQNEDLDVYLSVTNHAVSGVLVKENGSTQSPVYYVSKILVEAETRYTSLEKLVLALAITSIKLQHYFESHKIHIMTKFPLRNVLSKPDLTGRMAKWAIRPITYDIEYDARTTIKSQALANFLADFSPSQMITAEAEFQQIVSSADTKLWTLYTDGASNVNGTGLGLVLKSPQGAKDPKMVTYLDITKRLIRFFNTFNIQQIPRENNAQADALADLGAVSKGLDLNNILTIHIMKPAMERLAHNEEVLFLDQHGNDIEKDVDDWIRVYKNYLQFGA